MSLPKIFPPSGFVNAGILMAFDDAARRRADILDSALLAQLAADKKQSRFTAPESWYDFYTNTLGNLAWQVSRFSFQQYVPEGDSFTLEEILLAILEQDATASEVDLARESIRAFKELSEKDERVLVYDGFCRRSRSIDLQVAVSSTGSTVTSVGVLLETRHEITELFCEKIPVAQLKSQIQTVLSKGTLSEKAYAPLRAEVIAKLGERRKELILSLDFS